MRLNSMKIELRMWLTCETLVTKTYTHVTISWSPRRFRDHQLNPQLNFSDLSYLFSAGDGIDCSKRIFFPSFLPLDIFHGSLGRFFPLCLLIQLIQVSTIKPVKIWRTLCSDDFFLDVNGRIHIWTDGRTERPLNTTRAHLKSFARTHHEKKIYAQDIVISLFLPGVFDFLSYRQETFAHGFGATKSVPLFLLFYSLLMVEVGT